MSSEFDAKLTRLFAERAQALDGGAFGVAVMREIAQAARARARRRALLWALASIAIGAACALFPAKAALVIRSVGEISSAAAALMITPLGWVLSSIVGAYVLLRTRARTS
jgi:hypothetical protein